MTKINPKDYRPNFLKKALEEADKFRTTAPRTCLRCPTRLTPFQKHYCSGMCMNEAKNDGTYGHEQDVARMDGPVPPTVQL